MGTLQWFILFYLAIQVALPIVVGGIYLLLDGEIFYLIAGTLFCSEYIFLCYQGWLGHRLQLAVGRLASWVGVFTVLALGNGRTGSTYIGTTAEILIRNDNLRRYFND